MNVVLIAFVACVWLGLYVQTPARLGEPHQMAHLRTLEDAVARKPADGGALVALSDGYLTAGFPTLAMTVIRAADPGLLEEPAIAHQLARAYEGSGRLLDALATADLALARCARVLGARPLETAVPSYACSERTLASLDMHRAALARMVQWGVVDPRVDARAKQAYDAARRRARMAVGELPGGGTSN